MKIVADGRERLACAEGTAARARLAAEYAPLLAEAGPLRRLLMHCRIAARVGCMMARRVIGWRDASLYAMDGGGRLRARRRPANADEPFRPRTRE